MELIQWYHVWAFVKINDFGRFIGGLAFAMWLVSVVTAFIYVMAHCEDMAKYPKWKVLSMVAVALFLSFLNSILPTQKEVAAIYLIPKIVNSETAQQFAKDASGLPSDFVKLVKTKMDEWVTDSLVEQGKDKAKVAVKEVKETAKEVAKEVVNEAVKEVKK